MDIVTEKLNATVKYNKFRMNILNPLEIGDGMYYTIKNRSANGTLDFYINFDVPDAGALFSYNYVEHCFKMVNPKSYTVTELVLIMPFDR